MTQHGQAPFLECSSRGDRRFSAFYARVNLRGRIDSIEAHYQAAKVFADGVTGLTPTEAKAKQRTVQVVNLDECRALYTRMWDAYIAANPDLLNVLIRAKGLQDMFGQPGRACQATELWRIRCEALVDNPGLHAMNNLCYAGVGSRTTPEHALNSMRMNAFDLANQGWTLRSGAADGADTAYEQGCDIVPSGSKEIFIPWDNYQTAAGVRRAGEPDVYVGVSEAAMQLAAKHHPAWSACSQGAKKLLARDGYQVLGHSLDKPSKFVLCWCPVKSGVPQGGTAQAIRVAEAHGIPVFNMFDHDWAPRWVAWMAAFRRQNNLPQPK